MDLTRMPGRLTSSKYFYIAIITSAMLASIYGKSEFSENYFAVQFEPSVYSSDADMPDMYNEKELIFLVKKVSTRFKRLLLRNGNKIANEGSTRALIPSAVAKFNKFHNPPGARPLELIMHFRDPPPSQPNPATFQHVKNRADEANQLFPGTVKIFLIELPDIEFPAHAPVLSMAINKLKYLKSLVSNGSSEFQYKVGILVLPKNYCDSTNDKMWDKLVQVVSNSDVELVIFHREPAFEQRTRKSDGAPLSTLLNQDFQYFERCKGNLSAALGTDTEIEIGFKTWWPDTPNRVRNVSNLVSYWEELNLWAERSNTTVVLEQAFDTPASNLGTGWWRLVDNCWYESALDYVFEEKKFESPRMENASSDAWLKTYFPDNKSTSFNEENLAVMFDPYVSMAKTNSPGVTDLIPFLQQVSTEFRKIAVDIWPVQRMGLVEREYRDVQRNVSLVVSQLNRDAIFRRRMEVVILFLASFRLGNGTEEQLHEFKAMKDQLNQANSIFPKTIQTILVQPNYNFLEEFYLKYGLKELENMRQILEADSTFKYNLGVVLPIDKCLASRHNLQPNLTQILDNVETVIFSVDPPRIYDFTHSGLERFLAKYFRLFKFCKENVGRVSPQLTVGFSMEWPDTIKMGHQDIRSLVEFWGKVRNWARSKNTTVFMHEAFDNPTRGIPSVATRGWWRFTNNSWFGNVSDYQFEDKRTVLLREIRKRERSKSLEMSSLDEVSDLDVYEGVGIGLILAYVGVGVLCLVGIAFCGIAVVYVKCAKKKMALLLTKKEMDDFFNGASSLEPQLQPGVDGVVPASGYNMELECKSRDFLIDENVILGSGEFGIVFQAKLKRNEVELSVAAKTSKAHNAMALKGILAEIKILGYLGSHENIVSIVGAYTAELSQGNVYIFMELCGLGSLKEMLRGMKPPVVHPAPVKDAPLTTEDVDEYVDQAEFEDSGVESGGSRETDLDSATISELLKWAQEISCGMEFLASQHVVHADLATRNVLLTEGRSAKISDFGLSRRLYAYESYVKKQKDALPWRWMAPESLRKLEFDEKTDVWSFGVTLWEIFSLAEVPFVGLSWSANFIDSLENGLRLAKPPHDKLNIYSVMLACWSLSRVRRPPFSEIKVRLTSGLYKSSGVGLEEAETCL